MPTMRYLGGGFIPGIPARDLTELEVERCGGVETLAATGLYEEVTPPKRGKSKAEEPVVEEAPVVEQAVADDATEES